MLIIVALLWSILLFLSWPQIRHFEPAGVVSMLWLVLTGVCLVLSHFMALSYFGIAYILVVLIAFSVGSSCAKPKSHTIKKRNFAFNRDRAFIIVCIVTAAAFIKPIYDLTSQGFNVLLMREIEEVAAMSNEMSVQRYSDTVETSNATQLLGVFTVVAPLLAGFCLPYFRGWKRAVCFMSLVSSIFGALTQGAKMGLLMSAFVMASGYLVSCCSMGKRLDLAKANILKGGMAVFALFAILIVSMVFRVGQVDGDTIMIALEKFVSYSVGSVPCFDIWFIKNPVPLDTHTFGAKTFWGVSNFLGVLNRDSGIYQEMVYFGQNGLEGSSNVFTIFRVLIEDFGYITPLLLAFLLGYGIKRVYVALPVQGKGRSVYQVLLMAIYAYIFWSFVTSFFAYTTYIVTLVFMWMILYFVQRPRKKKIVTA